MKKRNVLSASIVFMVITLFCSCASGGDNSKNASNNSTEKQANDPNKEKLKGFLLAGIYTINGYGGAQSVSENLGENSSVDQQLKLLSFPFEAGQEGVKETLSSMWEINSKEDLEKRLTELLNNDKSAYKAWDYARLVNNVHMGFAAGYITKAEGEQWVAKVLPKAMAAFKTWDEYHKNFIEGRKKWNSEDADATDFESLVKDLNYMTIYKENPLN